MREVPARCIVALHDFGRNFFLNRLNRSRKVHKLRLLGWVRIQRIAELVKSDWLLRKRAGIILARWHRLLRRRGLRIVG